MSLVFRRILMIKRIGLGNVLRFRIALLVIDSNVTIQLVKFVQCLDFKLMLMFRSRYIAKGDKNGITWMVVNIVKGFELLVAEV